jgi:hypothetical protein
MKWCPLVVVYYQRVFKEHDHGTMIYANAADCQRPLEVRGDRDPLLAPGSTRSAGPGNFIGVKVDQRSFRRFTGKLWTGKEWG